jgi:adenylate cyclase
VASITTAEFQALGLYDPAAPDHAARLELLEFLVGLGASTDDLTAYSDQLPGLAAVVAFRGGPTISVAEAVERTGVPEHKLRRLNRAAGFPDPAPGDRTFSPAFAGLAADLAAAESLFGEEAVLQLVRVMGAAMSRVADALVSAFLVNVEPAARGEDPAGLGVARANAEAAGLMPATTAVLEILLRQHLIAARRTGLGDEADTGFETQPLAVGFVDLVGSSALARRLSTRELGAVLTEFENLAWDTVTARGGRVVKLIGDEILFTARDEAAACAIALDLSAMFARHPRVPEVRAGVAAGNVLLRDGDVFGPVVNIAARFVKLARPSELVAPRAVAEAAGLAGEPIADYDGIALCRVAAPDQAIRRAPGPTTG